MKDSASEILYEFKHFSCKRIELYVNFLFLVSKAFKDSISEGIHMSCQGACNKNIVIFHFNKRESFCKDEDITSLDMNLMQNVIEYGRVI
jgi:hypothetical protein